MPEQQTSTMRILKADADFDGFLGRLHESSRRLLMLDYDGTLAPFVEQRDKAVPYNGVREMLAALVTDSRTRVVVVSGRAVDDLRPLLNIDPLPEIWGSHGWERLHADGRYEKPRFPDGLREVLSHEWTWLEHTFDHRLLERKPASLALHWRGLPEHERRDLQQLAEMRWKPFRDMTQFDLHAFDGGVELRAAGRTKGDAVQALLAETPRQHPAAYLGDDQTDEDAFAALSGRGLRVLVRVHVRPTLADVHCIPPEGLLTFLHQWIEPS
jgi:trehalose-phosphatase